MNCEQAQHLFDAHLDGDLPPGLATELAAHRIECEDCRRQLALLEVVEHVLVSEIDEPEPLCDDFTDRLMACLPAAPRSWRRRTLVLAGGLAAAAALTFLVYGPWGGGNAHRVAGVVEPGEPVPDDLDPAPVETEDPVIAWQKTLDDIYAEWQRTRWGTSPLREGIEDTARELFNEFSPAPDAPVKAPDSPTDGTR
ncbi:MAG: hypothetical protein BroJett003_23750 [Planctomycetota bacterium]|nr:MAG: hypothetical protein BroJett003_23750 [Planctomycetota bacterium]